MSTFSKTENANAAKPFSLVDFAILPGSQQLVGREDSLTELGISLKKNIDKDASMLLLEGEGGVGKTAFANQLMHDLRTEFHFSIYGKFHNTPSKVPYMALKQCLHHWLDQLLLLEDEVFERLKDNVRQALHPHEYVLTSVLEELELLLGKKKEVPYLKDDPQKERLRFTYFFYKFLFAVHQSGLNTLIFLDDLQWSDMATLHLVHDLLKTYQIPGFMLIGAYRPDSEEGVKQKINKLKQLSQVRHHVLQPLGTQDLQKLIPAEWNLKDDEMKAFKEYLVLESGGKPFDALQLLSLIVQHKLVSDRADNSMMIRWNKLPRYKHDERSVRLIMKEILELSLNSIRLLQMASCIGFYFSCERLKQLALVDEAIFDLSIQELIAHKMIIIQQEYCYFVHDHYYSAAQMLLPLEEKKRYHAEISRYLMGQGALEPHHPEFFFCINHLNLTDTDTTVLPPLQIAALNLAAGDLAKKKSAFDKSLEYYRVAEKWLLRPETSDHQAEVFLPFKIQAENNTPAPANVQRLLNICQLGIAECEFLLQNFLVSNKLLNDIIEQVDDSMMKLKAYTIKMKICVACLNLKDAPLMLKDGMGITEALLKSYQISLPQNDAEFERFMKDAYDELLSLIPEKNIDKLVNYKMSEDQEFIDLINLVVHSLPIIFFVNIQKSKYLAIRSMILCLQHGFASSTPALFASSIWTLASLGNDLEFSYQVGMLGIRLVEKSPYSMNRHMVYHLATLNFYNWKHHYRESSARLDEAVAYSLSLGDHNYALFCYTNARILDIFRGLPLQQHILQLKQHKSELLHIHFVGKSHVEFVRYMSGQKAGLVEGKFRFSKILKQQVSENFNGMYHFNFVKELLYMYAGNYQKALEAGQVCEKHRMLYEGLPIGNEHDFYFAIILCMKAEESGVLDDTSRTHVEERLAEMKRLANLGSGNYLHKQKMMEAELARFEKHCFEVVSLYDDAIDEALRQEFIHLAALSAERCGSYLLRHKKQRLAESYLHDAYQYYEKWGAKAKMQLLEQKFPSVFFRRAHHTFHNENLTDTHDTLRWELVQSAIQLSQELYVNDLIKKVLEISREQTQAMHASFLLKQPFSWQLVARLDNEGFSMLHRNLPISSKVSPQKTLYDCLKLNEICYVPYLTERHELYDVTYFKDKEVSSFMVVPFERHKEVLGLIYLENLNPQLVDKLNLLPWFELLRIQTGIALSNAQLFENQQVLNQEIRKQEKKRLEAIVETQEKERKRVAAELHDHLGQMLALVKLNFSRLEDSLVGQFKLYEESCQILDESCGELRRIAHDMMPPDLEKRELTDILDDLFRKYLPGSGLTYRFHAFDLPAVLPLVVKLNLYRMTQEIIHNIIKHAQARHVTIELNEMDGRLHLMIADDGKGFDTQFKTDGIGLRNLHSRVSMLNGRLDIDSGLSRGSVFHIHIPIT